MRASGILLPISCLPSRYGIGSFSKYARQFVDMCVSAGQTFWQILPLGPTGYGDSPYQSFSAFAGNPYFIDLDALIGDGILGTDEVVTVDFGGDPSHVDYGKLYMERFPLLRTAALRSRFEEEEDYRKFYAENKFWLDDYALFMAIKNTMNAESWTKWPDRLRLREAEALSLCLNDENIVSEVRFFKFLQYEFARQWIDLKSYANSRGLKIIGDIPIYVSPDSSDAWANGELFQFDADHRPESVAGCPPDAFAAEGQLWGNPLYNWSYHEETGFSWWKKRIAHCLRLYDVVRIDHFRGFDAYYSIPATNRNAVGGHWENGPGMQLFDALRENPDVTEHSIIAEDLGFLTPSVIQLVKDTHFPGMKVLEFAFDSRDTGMGYLPHTYVPNTVVYTGTHDNQTLASWFDELSDDDHRLACDYMGFTEKTTKNERNWAFIRMAFESVSDTCIIPMQDFLVLGREARMNTPSTMGGNWTWRMLDGQFTQELASRILRLTKIAGRANGR